VVAEEVVVVAVSLVLTMAERLLTEVGIVQNGMKLSGLNKYLLELALYRVNNQAWHLSNFVNGVTIQ